MTPARPHSDDAAVELLLRLLSISSETGHEDVLAGFVHEYLLETLPSTRRIGNAVVAFSPPRGLPLVAFAGHLDTVLRAPGDTNTPRESGDRIQGLGASDMKAAIACDLLLSREADFSRIPYDLCWIFYDKEEGPIAENGLKHLWGAVPEIAHVSAAICGEPTDNAIQLGCVGTLHAKVTFRGRAAHSARPWQGENAIHKAASLLEQLSQMQARDVTMDGLLYREVMSATMASGGRSKNVIPDKFELNINARFSAATPPSAVEQTIRGMACGADVEIIDCAPAAAPKANHPVIQRFIELTGAPVEAKQAWTDVAQFSERGIAAFNFGPGEQAQAHQRGESISRAHFLRGLALRRKFLGII